MYWESFHSAHPGIIPDEIVDDLELVLAQFRLIANDLGGVASDLIVTTRRVYLIIVTKEITSWMPHKLAS